MDNFYQNCPAVRMQTGARDIGDFKGATRRNEYIKFVNGIWRDDQYRVFLQKNTTEIQDREWAFYKKANVCREQGCVHNFPTLSSPQQYVEQRKAAEAQLQGKKCPCKKFPDYRLNPDLNTRL